MTALGILFIVIFFVAYFRKKSTRDQQAVEDSFWERENLANNTRKQSLDDLSYITIPLEKFPIGIYKDPDLKAPETLLTALSSKKIVNLDAFTNTDLKLQYGAANLDILTEYGENFDALCRALADYGEALYEDGHREEARTVLEFGIESGSDISRNYLTLGKIYREEELDSDFNELLSHARELISPMKDSIVHHLEAMA
jgi:hypothetical protein